MRRLPELVHQEIWAWLLVHHAISVLITCAAEATDIDPDRVVIRFGTDEVYPRPLADDQLVALSRYLERDEVLIHVSLGTGDAFARVWGCDLTDGYIRINADYTT